jgi:N-acetylglutamate synthase-like GNAT family acetyltransferase
VLAAMEVIRSRLHKAGDFAVRPYNEADLSFIINGQLELYDAEYGFTSPVWKDYVAQAVRRLDAQFDAALDQMVILEYKGEPAGCIAVAHAGEGTAQLRFFFLKPAVRGLGIGGRLMETALAFCREKSYRHAFLLTSDKLDAARYLYAKHGFRLTDAHHNADWGAAFVEERWDLELA